MDDLYLVIRDTVRNHLSMTKKKSFMKLKQYAQASVDSYRRTRKGGLHKRRDVMAFAQDGKNH